MDNVDIQGLNLVGDQWSTNPESSYLLFEVGRRRIGIDGQYIREVVKYLGQMPIQNSNPLVSGVVHHGRDFLPVFDLSRVFSDITPDVPDENTLVIVNAQGCVFGMIAGPLVDFTGISESAIVAGGLEDAGIIHNEFFQGVALFEQHPTLLMNPAQMISQLRPCRFSMEDLHQQNRRLVSVD